MSEVDFWSFVNRNGPIPVHVPEIGPCWLWTGTPDDHGYGRFCLNGRQVGAHRVSWILTNGLIPEGQHVLHHCDNPPCVRPEHLWLGTALDNAHDRQAKGRGVRPRQKGGGRRAHQEEVLHPRRPPQGDRTRKSRVFTLSKEARERLREMAEEQGRPASRVVEDLILTKR